MAETRTDKVGAQHGPMDVMHAWEVLLEAYRDSPGSWSLAQAAISRILRGYSRFEDEAPLLAQITDETADERTSQR